MTSRSLNPLMVDTYADTTGVDEPTDTHPVQDCYLYTLGCFHTEHVTVSLKIGYRETKLVR